MLKKVLSIVLSALICAAMCVCGVAEESAQVTLYYPSYLQESEGEALVLDQMPERIVCLSNAALQILVRCGIQPVAVTEPTASVEYPDWVYDLPVISTSMSSLDTEAIIAMEPDLLIVGSYQKETYGQQFADAGIPVYYTSEGPSIAYGEAREEAITLARSFGSEELAAEVEAEFEAVEARAAAYTASHDSQTMMIFFYTPGTYFQTSEGYLGSMLSMLPFENLADTVVDPASRTLPTDIETCLTLDPEVIFAISPTAATADVIQALYEETFAQEPALWEQFSAVANDNVIYLSSEYVTSKGIQVIDSLNALIDLLEARYPADTTAAAGESETEPAGVTIEYPANMQQRGYTEPVVLETMPQRVACLSSSPVLALYEMGVPMIAIPTSSVVEWPEDLAATAEQLQLSHNTNFDVETVIALEPDLVIMGYTSQETYGNVVSDAGIPVYYVDAGHTVPYDSIKMQTEALVNAFGADSEAGATMLQRFDDLEARLEDVRAQLEGKTVMVLQSSPPAHYIQTSDGTLGSMAEMIGLTNVYENDASSMVQLDYETALSYNPDLVLCVGMSETGEGHRELMEADFANNPEYWNSIPAIANGDVLYLPVRFVSSAGINVVDNIGDLADLVLSHFAQ
ncbi:MAG TPA: ABC transporter substrate-binding protein [Candidatus Pullichristensenella avicola]|nr:ABC transporter substrate-binding protein [Candidatus Pullichristensenella avicola]